jgi:predicted  nucleic acid-binding Zn-ribbon protein
MKEKIKYYKCLNCGRISTICTLGDIYKGCANCGGQSGFLQKEGKRGKWQMKNQRTPELDMLNRFLR